MYILTDGWVTLSEHPQFNDFSNMSNEDKRIYHLIDELGLPAKLLIRIYQKEQNVVVAIRDIKWKFHKNRFFPISKFETICTVTPKRVYCSNVQKTGRLLCMYFGYQVRQQVTKPMLRKILKQGAEICKTLEEPTDTFPYGFSPDDIKIYTDNPKVFSKRLGEHHELYDLFIQARKLNKVIKMSWSDRKIHDMHMKWTEEIHKIKYRNCSSDVIWKNIPMMFNKVELLNSERRIADEGANMHHCIYTNYGNYLKAKTKIAFHVAIEDSFTVMFDIYDGGKVVFNQAYHAWNKSLTPEERQMAEDLVEYASLIVDANPLEQKQESDLPDIFNLF